MLAKQRCNGSAENGMVHVGCYNIQENVMIPSGKIEYEEEKDQKSCFAIVASKIMPFVIVRT
jgi:hypothetical protein